MRVFRQLRIFSLLRKTGLDPSLGVSYSPATLEQAIRHSLLRNTKQPQFTGGWARTGRSLRGDFLRASEAVPAAWMLLGPSRLPCWLRGPAPPRSHERPASQFLRNDPPGCPKPIRSCRSSWVTSPGSRVIGATIAPGKYWRPLPPWDPRFPGAFFMRGENFIVY